MSADNADRTGVVLMAYGTPRRPDEIEPYYTDIRRGRPPTPEALADLVARYDAIGGISPLAVLTEDQRDALQRALDEREPDRFHVTLGLKHADPKVEAGAAELSQAGFGQIVGVGPRSALLVVLDRPVPAARSRRSRAGRRHDARSSGSTVGRPNLHSSSSSPTICDRATKR